MFNFFRKKVIKPTAFEVRLALMPTVWIVLSDDENGWRVVECKLDDNDSPYPWVHIRWNPKNKYDCGGMTMDVDREFIFKTEEEAKIEYRKRMNEYGGSLIKMGLRIIWENS